MSDFEQMLNIFRWKITQLDALKRQIEATTPDDARPIAPGGPVWSEYQANELTELLDEYSDYLQRAVNAAEVATPEAMNDFLGAFLEERTQYAALGLMLQWHFMRTRANIS